MMRSLGEGILLCHYTTVRRTSPLRYPVYVTPEAVANKAKEERDYLQRTRRRGSLWFPDVTSELVGVGEVYETTERGKKERVKRVHGLPKNEYITTSGGQQIFGDGAPHDNGQP